MGERGKNVARGQCSARILHGEPTPRIARIQETINNTPCSICLERPRLMRRFRSTSQGRAARKEHPLVRRALMLSYIFSNRVPRVYEDELVIGNMTSKRVAANYYPEGVSMNILEDLHRLEDRPVPMVLTPREKLELAFVGIREIPNAVAVKALCKPGRITHFLRMFRPQRYIVTEEAGVSHQVGGYHAVVHQGLKPVDQTAARCLESGELPGGGRLDVDHEAFYRSVRIAIAGIRKMAENLAAEAGRIAALPRTSPRRRDELARLKGALTRVPYEPAQTFLEGLQSCWLIHICLNLEDYEQGLSFGRLDRILDPLYRRDIDHARLTPKAAAEMIASFYLKTCETIPLYSDGVDQGFSGNTVGQAITLGGTDPHGDDATGELSGLFLDAFAMVRTREPNLEVRVHRGTPDWLLERAVELLQGGSGGPAFYGDAACVRAMERAGVSTEHARDYAVVGCVELSSPGRSYNSSDAALFNLPLCLELALNQGHTFDGKKLGADTPPVTGMLDFEQLVAAFRAQVRDAVDEMARVLGWIEQTYRIHRTTPVNSIITQGAVENGRDVTWGSALYDMTSVQCVGLADTGDSLTALKRLVFEERRLSLEELVEILKSNFAGHERLRMELKKRFGRYGNGDQEADSMTQLASDAFADAVWDHRNTRGGRYITGFYSMTCGTQFGLRTGALPNGRPARARLSNGFSPVDGADVNGPTAVLRSAAGLDKSRWSNGGALNLKFDQGSIQGRTGRHALKSLLRTYLVELDGMQVQLNVLDADMLRAARADPSAHPNLLVRVSGYCAYFGDLQPRVQDEIIERTSHGIS